MHVTPLVWAISIAVTIGFLVIDVVVIARRRHQPSPKEAAAQLAILVGVAVAFGVGVAAISGPQYGGEFFAGWLTEYSLSIDNLFIFILILARFSVPRDLQSSALMTGIVFALVCRAVFIVLGAAAIHHFSWVFFVFGGFLVVTAVKLLRSGSVGSKDEGDNATVRWLRTVLPSAPDFHGTALVTRLGGRRVVTPLLLVVVALGTTDVIFALDSIPAIYGLTSEPYLVFATNVFALLGLRQLYFLIGGLLRRLSYLSYGLGLLLGFVGIKLVIDALRENSLVLVNGGRPVGWAPEIPIWLSLVVIAATLATTTIASLVFRRRRDDAAVG